MTGGREGPNAEERRGMGETEGEEDDWSDGDRTIRERAVLAF